MNSTDPENLLSRLLSAESKVTSRAKQDAEPRSCEHWTAPILLERTAYLRKLARAGEGFATETVKAYPGHSATLTVRLRNGPAEQLDHFALVLTALEGRAALVTGGLLEKEKRTPPGERTGTTITGGSSTELRPGDVVHVAAGIPHQLLVPADKPFSYLSWKVREIDKA